MIVTLPNGNVINSRDVRLVEKLIEGPGGCMFYITVADLKERIHVGTVTWREGQTFESGKYVPNSITKEQVHAAYADLLTKWNAS